jgi:hypothetical protein
MYKKCSKCKEEKLFSEFSKHKSQKDGYHNQCKFCVKSYRELNKEKISDYNKKYYQCNREDIIAYHAEYYASNTEQILVKAAAYREANKDKISLQNAEYRKVNKEQISLQYKDYYQTNKDKLSKSFAEYYQANKKHLAYRIREWRQINKEKVSAHNSKRRATKLNATPKWLSAEDYIKIQELYEIAQAFRLYTGQEYHVDHIVPLQGKNVCGLHVPWNLQVLEASENLSKHNKFLVD